MLLSRDRSLAGHECGGIRARPSARPSFGSSAALLLTERARSAAEAPLSCANLDSGVVNRLIGPGKRIYLANTRSDPGRPVAHRRVTPLLCPVAGYSPTPLVSGRFPFRPHPRDDFFDKLGLVAPNQRLPISLDALALPPTPRIGACACLHAQRLPAWMLL